MAEGSIIKNYLDSARSLTFEERGKLLENDSAFTAGHQELALEGQTEANPDLRVYHHFIALIHKDGQLLELDGRKSYPVVHGPTTPETLLTVSLHLTFMRFYFYTLLAFQDAAVVCKAFMARDPEEVRFTVIAITPNAS